ncbi:MAG TPA: hypothetical protein DEB39_16955 [Planctomycetaceae bacterium]|nr:hypothetical protein [Planctomycetaceae bacterium]
MIACCVFGMLCMICMTGCQTWHDGMVFYDDNWRSINGADVFHDMCKAGKHKVRRTRFVSKRYKRIDTVVWFCDDEMGVPDQDAIDWFEKWLEDRPGRTLVFVPRTYETDVDYWEKTVPLSKPADQWKAEAKLREAESHLERFLADSASAVSPSAVPTVPISPPSPHSTHTRFRLSRSTAPLPDKTQCDWFSLEKRRKVLVADRLKGVSAWTDRLDVSTAPLSIHVSLDPKGTGWTTLLAGESTTGQTIEPLVVAKDVAESRLIVLQSGVFLLNEALVEHERRKLASRLIAEFGEPKKSVAVLRMGSGLKYIEDEEAHMPQNSPLVLLQLWPVAILAWQLILLGIAYTFWRWPIFGRPKRIAATKVADFERHIDAYAEMLARSQDRTYAYNQIERYLTREIR